MALNLPKGHWMHAVAAKEQDRLSKKKKAKPAAGGPVAGGMNVKQASMPLSSPNPAEETC